MKWGGTGGGESGALTIRRVGMHYLEGGKDHTIPKKTAAGRSSRLSGGKPTDNFPLKSNNF